MASTTSQAAYEAPNGEVEETLAIMWSELLRLDPISRHDNFFDLGGHSLIAVQLIGKIANRYGRAISIDKVFEYPTIKLLASLIRGCDDGQALSDLTPISQ